MRQVKYLTKQEQIVLCLILALVLAGWAVKVYRTAHPANTGGLEAKNLICDRQMLKKTSAK